MSYHRIVLTTGTSALSGPNQPLAWLRDQDPALLARQGHRVVPAGPEAAEALLARWVAELPAIVDPARVSAEYSLLDKLRAMGRLGAAPHVTLIHTATVDGDLAARMIARLLERDLAAHVALRAVDDLDVSDRARLRRSLGGFMHIVADELRKGEPRTTCFAPLGGYKVMTALGYVAGAFLGFPTAYLHEDQQVLHEVPSLPFRIDPDELAALAPLIRKTRSLAEWQHLTHRERQQVDAATWLFERDHDTATVALNAFGHFLREEPAYRHVIGPLVRVHAQVHDALRAEDRRRFAAREVADLLAALNDLAHRAVLHHEVDFDHHGTPWHLYKGSSNGQSVFRAVYRYHAPTDTLDLRRIWFDHDRYEREARRVGPFLAQPDDDDPSRWSVANERLLRG